MKINILKNKITFSMFVILWLCISPIKSDDSSASFIESPESNILLCFNSKNSKGKNEEKHQLQVLYLGNLYETLLSSHFGGQLVLKDWAIQNKYYVVVSDHIDLILDNNSCIKGYKIKPEHSKNAKMYVMYLKVTINEKNDMTYNWNIEEIEIPARSLPDNTIIIYSDPEDISFAQFDKKFDKTYPKTTDTASSVIILPQATFDCEGLKNHSLKNNTPTFHTYNGHKKIASLLS